MCIKTRHVVVLFVTLLTIAATRVTLARSSDKTPRGPFGLSMVATADDEKLDITLFEGDEYCGECHERQFSEMQGSMHSISHEDTLYRSAAEMALREAGPEVYALCSGCHTPQGVAAGLVPGTPEEELPEAVISGIQCETCHSVESLNGVDGPWGEPGNGSIVLAPDADRKFGPGGGDPEMSPHTMESREFFKKSEFCASCHTVIHPFNGVRLEHTYAEWKASPYAEAGIQCQDCHMREVEEAAEVARTMRPLEIVGLSSPVAEVERPIARHFFVGGNTNAAKLGGGERHAAMAGDRLRSAATLAIEVPDSIRAGETLKVGVTVANVAAGHSLPTSLVELRRIWVDLRVTDDSGEQIFRSGWIDREADLGEDVMRFGALAGDDQGRPTYKPWEVAQFLWKRMIPAKESVTDVFEVPVPPGAEGSIKIDARLFYVGAPEFVARALMGERYVELDTVEMASASATLSAVQ
jgi:nitrate reductase cytochrome c-type subunit